MENEVAQQTKPSNKFEFPTETIDLPSGGIVYPKDNPLSSGKIEMKYMTAKEEDILTNPNYIRQGTVVDRLLKSLIITDINYNDLVIGDKNVILLAARILGYGKEYKFTYLGDEQNIDLSELDNKIIDESLFQPGNNEFSFTLPYSATPITFKLLTHKDEQNIDKTLKGYAKINKNNRPEMTTRLKAIILSIKGEYDRVEVNKFVDTYLLARDGQALRKYIKEIQPDVISKFTYTNINGVEEEVDIPIGGDFFYPD